MRFQPVIRLSMALITVCTALWAGHASAKCHQIANSRGFDAHTKFTLCDNQQSQIRLNAQEVAKYASIAGRGDIVIMFQSPSIDFATKNANGWGGRGGYNVPLPDYDDALSLAKAINAGETIVITARNKAQGETHTVFSGVFAMTFPAEFIASNPEEKTPALAASAAQDAPVKEAQKPYPVSDLPSGLTSVTLIPFAEGKEAAWQEEYLTSIPHHASYINKSCEATAYPYRRAHAYWDQVDNALPQASYQAPYAINRQSAATLCADKTAAAEYRGKLLHHPQRAFDRLCTLLNTADTYRNPNLLSVKAGAFETACYDLATIRANGQDQCMRAYLPNMGETERSDYCSCVGEKVADYYADGTEKFSSKTSVQASSRAMTMCRTQGKAQ